MSQQYWEGLEMNSASQGTPPSSQDVEVITIPVREDSFKLARNPSLLRDGFVTMLTKPMEPPFKIKKAC